MRIRRMSLKTFCTRQARDRLKHYPKRRWNISAADYVKMYCRDNHLKVEAV